MEADTYKTTRIWAKTLRTLRFIHAMTGESIVAIIDRLAKQELARLKQENKDDA